jgi:hypothetical protein
MNPLTETPQMIFAAMAETVEQQLMPHLDDASSRAAAASMLQVLAQLSVTVAWDPAPLADRLQARRDAFARLAAAGATGMPDGLPGRTDAVALEQAIHDCDAWAAAQVGGGRALAPPIGRALLAYGRAAAEADLRFMAPSHLGKLTRRRAAAATAKEGT